MQIIVAGLTLPRTLDIELQGDPNLGDLLVMLIDGDEVKGSARGALIDGVFCSAETSIDELASGCVVQVISPLQAERLSAQVGVRSGLFGESGLVRHRGRVRFNRPPRVLAVPQPELVEVPEPPKAPSASARLSVAMLLVPVIMGVVMMIVFSPIMAVFAALTPVMMGGQWLEDKIRIRRYHKRVRKLMVKAAGPFAEALELARNEELRLREERGIRGSEPLATADGSPRLWERRPHHPDFLHLGIGAGVIAWDPPLVTISGDPEPEIAEVIERFSFLPGAEMTAPVTEGRLVGLAGDRRWTTGLARLMVIEAALAHGPADVRIAVLTGENHRSEWEWAKWLPHVAVDGQTGRRRLAATDRDAEHLLRLLATPPDSEDSTTDVVGTPPVTLLVVDRSFKDRDMARMLHDTLAGSGLPVAGIVIAELPEDLPGGCTHTLTEHEGQLVLLEPATGSSVGGVTQALLDVEHCEAVARRLARWDDPMVRDGSVDLPSMVSLLELVGLPDPTPEAVLEKWSVAPQGTLAAPIGVSPDGPLVIDLVLDGPHALVGGTTGSGKSELLRAIVASFAAVGSPEDINFVLVDYKGGSAFDRCADLPHVVGVVTDLDDRLAERALTCIEAELHYRERLLRDAQAEDLAAYRALDVPKLPRLLLMIDEFAALASELPDFMASLVDIAQRGRSLGIHLMLATQRPAGVVNDNIRANTNMRISLRVQSKGDSQDVVDSGAAATIARSRPGRALMRLGPGELIPFQSALVTGTGSVGPVRTHAVSLRSFDFGFELEPFVRGTKREEDSGEVATDLERLVAAAVVAAQRSGSDNVRQLWPDELSVELAVSDLDAHEVAGSVVLGVVDDPKGQRQFPLTWSVEVGSLALFGTPGSGAGDALLTVAHQVIDAFSPDEAWLYGFDLGAGRLGDLVGLPHVGAVVGPGDRERQKRLLRLLSGELADRQRRGVDGRPNVFMLVDNYAAFAAEYSDPTEYVFQDMLTRVIANGADFGMFVFVVTAVPGGLPSQVAASISERFVFALADTADYASFGLTRRGIPELVERRCIQVRSGLVAQVAAVEPVDIERLFDRFVGVTGSAPVVGRLPEVVKAADLVESATLCEVEWFLPVGVGDNALAPVGLRLSDGEHALVVGPARSGRTMVLRVLAEIVKQVRPDVGVTAFCLRRSALAGDVSLDRVVTDAGEVPDAVEQVLAAGGPQLVLIDDCMRIDDSDGAFGRLMGSENPELHVVGAARSDLVRGAYGHWSRELRRGRQGVLLAPQPDADAEVFSTALPKSDQMLVPGRGVLVAEGRAELIQAAQL